MGDFFDFLEFFELHIGQGKLDYPFRLGALGELNVLAKLAKIVYT